MRTTLWRKLTAGVLLFAMLLTTTGCYDSEFLLDLASIFLPDVISYGVLGTSGDESLDAIFEAKAVLDQIDEADELREKAMWNRDQVAMEQAVALRPNDTTIRLDAVELATGLDDQEAADKHLNGAKMAIIDRPEDRVPLVTDILMRFENMKEYADGMGYQSRQQCSYIHRQLELHYDTLWQLNGNQGAHPASAGIRADALRCGERVK